MFPVSPMFSEEEKFGIQDMQWNLNQLAFHLIFSISYELFIKSLIIAESSGGGWGSNVVTR